MIHECANAKQRPHYVQGSVELQHCVTLYRHFADEAGRYGYFESLDYSSRHGKREPELVQCFMAHHQGMGLAAIDNTPFENRLQERFHFDPFVQATDFLLQERMPELVEVEEEEKVAVA